jgi:hypothetical protein
MRVSKLRVGFGIVIWRTPLTGGDTMLTWMRPVAVRCQPRDWRVADVPGGAVTPMGAAL